MASGPNWLQDATQAAFHTTQWGVVLQAADVSEAVAQGALADLYRSYWPPLYAFARRRGLNRHDAEDAVQGFFSELFASSTITRADAEKGKFRTFLLGAFTRFLAGQWNRAHAQKRGGGIQFVPIHDAEIEAVETQGNFAQPAAVASPQDFFEQRWAVTVLETCLRRIEKEALLDGSAGIFAAARPWLIGDPSTASLEAPAASLGLTISGFKTLIHRLRREFGNVLRREVARTLADPNDLEGEIQHLRDTLGRVLP